MIRSRLTASLLPLALGALLAACDTGKTIGEAEDDVRATLRDPSSAEFSEEIRYPPTKDAGAVICGKVNAKNAFGGMTGPKRFLSGGMTLIDDDSDATASGVFQGAWDKLCTYLR